MRMPYKRGDFRKYLVVVGLLAGYTTPYSILLGLPFLLIGIGFHIWAKGCLHQNQEVTVTGPYRFVRHPFYAGNAFLDAGIGIMSGWWLLLVVLPLWWLLVYIPTIRSEETVLTGLYGDTYREYRTRVPMILPWRRPLACGSEGFSWQNPNIARTELPRILRFLCYPLIFFMAYRFHVQGTGVLLYPAITDVFAVVTIIAFFLMGTFIRIHFKERRRILPKFLSWDFRMAILVAVVILGVGVHHYEIEADWAVWLPGFVLIGISIWRAMRREPVVAEALLAVGLALLFELHWLAILVAPLYIAVFLDLRLRGVPLRLARSFKVIGLQWASAMTYRFLLPVGIVLSIVKELWLC